MPPTKINVAPDVQPTSPVDEQPTIGLIGMGDMGKMYAKHLSEAGWRKIHVCDLPAKYDSLQQQYASHPSIRVFQDGHAVARSSDFIIYSVEAEFIDKVVAEYGPSTKMNAIVGGQTSVKAPEKAAFEKYLPDDTHIISCHSLHGPTVSPLNQPLVIIDHRSTPDALALAHTILSALRSRFVTMSYASHDLITATTQATTHAAFLSMGSAWASAQSYPWEEGNYVGGIETVKVNLALRVYSNKWHVYAGLAILNERAREQIEQYARSVTELFRLMVQGGREGSGGRGGEEARRAFRERVEWGRKTVFGDARGADRVPILLSEEILDRFSLGKPSPVPPAHTPEYTKPSTPARAHARYKPNSHLSLLAMVDCWAQLGINPYHNLLLASTPLFRLFLGVAEHLFHHPPLLALALSSALEDTWHRRDDLEFVVAARGWCECVRRGEWEVFRRRFEETKKFFEAEGRFEEVGRLGAEMIRVVMESGEVQGGEGGN
ncbi:hypothetical protein AX16_000831 [Volvariella volvacea WC 439]|nr:hypothetical protein AX16_000831 [Volvariella volvacea WC 439]